MSHDFGTELFDLRLILSADDIVRLTSSLPNPDGSDLGLEVGLYIDAFISVLHTIPPIVDPPIFGGGGSSSLGSAPNGFILYLPPGRYNLGRRPTDPSGQRSRYVLPENVQLYFCQGALLRPAEGVDLVIQGSLHAGKYQVFGYSRNERAVVPLGTRTVPAGRVIFATDQVRAVRPEWWGAVSGITNDQIGPGVYQGIGSWGG